MSKPETTLPEKLRDMASDCKDMGAPYDAPELMRIAANRIEDLEADVQRLHAEKDRKSVV